MPRIDFSSRALIDLSEIADYTIEKWGIQKARLYRDGFNKTFQTISKQVNIGRNASEFSPNLKRFSYKSHIIFYAVQDMGILIVRVLNQSMDIDKHIA